MENITVKIRSYEPADKQQLHELFERAGEGSPSGELWGHPASERAVYLEPYLENDPKSVFVAEKDGELLGYLTGCLDSSELPREEKRMDQAIKDYNLMRNKQAMKFFMRAMSDQAIAKLRKQEVVTGDFEDARYPAHCHINVLREARGQGVAQALMQQWFKRMEEAGVSGCYLQTLTENARATRFFEKMGFEKYGTELIVPGVRYKGKKVHQLTMLR